MKSLQDLQDAALLQLQRQAYVRILTWRALTELADVLQGCEIEKLKKEIALLRRLRLPSSF